MNIVNCFKKPQMKVWTSNCCFRELFAGVYFLIAHNSQMICSRHLETQSEQVAQTSAGGCVASTFFFFSPRLRKWDRATAACAPSHTQCNLLSHYRKIVFLGAGKYFLWQLNTSQTNFVGSPSSDMTYRDTTWPGHLTGDCVQQISAVNSLSWETLCTC